MPCILQEYFPAPDHVNGGRGGGVTPPSSFSLKRFPDSHRFGTPFVRKCRERVPSPESPVDTRGARGAQRSEPGPGPGGRHLMTTELPQGHLGALGSNGGLQGGKTMQELNGGRRRGVRKGGGGTGTPAPTHPHPRHATRPGTLCLRWADGK